MVASEVSLVLLDVRRRAAFHNKPMSIPGSVPLILDVDDLQIPDLPRNTPIVTFCLCSGEASSTRVALWLINAGYENISVLVGGLPKWESSDGNLETINTDVSMLSWQPAQINLPQHSAMTSIPSAQPLLAETSFLVGHELPSRRDLAVMFVDMVDSTPLLFRHSNEHVLELVQIFMAVVVDTAVHHCGDVHDFEGDGAMLYFAGAGEALPAAFRLRQALEKARVNDPDLPQARFSIDAGPVVIGHIGTRLRRSLAFIGPCVNTAARILKYAPPNCVAVTRTVFDHALVSNPDLVQRFEQTPETHLLKGIGDEPVEIYLSSL